MQSKQCTKCGEVKPESGFSKRRAVRDGLQPQCKGCNRAYREAHWDEVSARERAYREAHRDEISARNRAYGEAHREEIRVSKRAYYEEHRDEIAVTQRKWRAETRSASREVATRNGEPWTPAEDRVVLTSEGTRLEIAITLGRTVSSIEKRRRHLRRKAVTA